MAFQPKHMKGLSPKLENPSKDGGAVDASINNNNNNNAPKYGTVIPNRIFVGGISSATTESDLTQLFSGYGRVTGTKIIADRAGVSKGYGFVTFETEEEAKRLQKDADNIVLRERRLNIAPAIKKQGFVRNFDQGAGAGGGGTCPLNGAGGGSASQVYQNGISYAYHNGMAFFSPTSTSAPVTPIPSAPVDPNIFTGAYANPPPPVAAYAPSMIYPTPVFFQNPQYQFQVPYDGCYTVSEGQGGGAMIVQNGNGDSSGGGGGTNGGGYQGSVAQHVAQGQSQSQAPVAHYQEQMAFAVPPQGVAPSYTCVTLPHQEPPQLIHYAVPTRRPYEPAGFIEWQNNESRNQPQSSGRCYQGEVEPKANGGNNECSNSNNNIKPDSTAEVSEMKPKVATPVVSLRNIESEEELQISSGLRPQPRRRMNNKPVYQSGNGKHLNNNNPEATDRNLVTKPEKRSNNYPLGAVRTNPPHHPLPPLYPSECPSFNVRPSSLQVSSYPSYCAPSRTYYSPGMVHLPQQRRVSNNHRRHSAGGRGGRYRGGGSSHNSSRSSSSQGRAGGGGSGIIGGGGGGSLSTEGGGGEGEASLTPPTTPRCSPTIPSAAPNSNSITHTIQALSL